MHYKTLMAEFEAEFKGKEDVNSVSEKRKHFMGVTKNGNWWQAKIRNPKLKTDVYLGSYSTPEEAALVVKNKKAEFPGRKLPCGVTRDHGKFRVQIWHPELKKMLSFGSYSTCDEAAVVADRKRAELQELYGGKWRGSSEREDRKRKRKRAELREVDGGKARGVGKNKKAEFEEMLKSEDGLRMRRRCGDEFQGRKLPFGVRSQSGKFRVRFWHPGLKKFASFGYYSTCDEAAVVAKRKRAELQELYGGKLRGSSEREDGKRKRAELREVYGRKARGIGVCEDDDEEVLQETESLEAAGVANRKKKRKRAKLSEVYGGKVRGNGECEDDEEVLREATSEVAGKFECSDEQEKTVLDTKMKRAEFEEQYKGKKDVNIVEDDFCDGGSDGLNNFETSDKLNCWLVDVPDKLECEFVHGSCTSNIEVGTSNTACVGDKRVIDQMSQSKRTCSLDFDEAVSAGFINEYGQLMGKYRELDEQLYLGLPEENVAASR